MSSGDSNKGRKTLLGSLGILGVLAIKCKAYIFVAWKALAFLKIGWLLSPLLTLGSYALLWGWPFAFMILLLLFIHEMGHWVWMKALGLEPKAPVFVPFVGAYVAMTKLPADQTTHAWVALAGPLVGGLGSVIMYWFGIHSDNQWLVAAGSTGFMLNLLQLVPAKPLDGGFVIQAISRWLLVPGTGILFMLAFTLHSVLLLIISAVSLFSLIGQFTRRKENTITNTEKYEMLINQQRRTGPSLAEDGTLVSAPKDPLGSSPTLSQSARENATPYGGNIAPPGVSVNVIKRSEDLIPASPPQRILIAIAYLSLAGMLSYLYWLSTNELTYFLHHK